MNIIYNAMLIIGIVGLIITEVLYNKQFTKEVKNKDFKKWKLKF